MMRKAHLLLLLFCLPAIMAQNYGAGAAHVGLMAAPPAAAGSDFCDTAGSNLWCEDWEAGIEACDNVGQRIPADLLSPTAKPECNYTATAFAPLNGVGSAFFDGTTGSIESAEWTPGGGIGCDLNNCRYAFKFLVPTNATTSTQQVFFESKESGGDIVMQMRVGTNDKIIGCRANETDGDSANFTYTQDVLYYICLDYDFSTDIGHIYIDATAQDCTGTADFDSACGSGATNRTNISQHVIQVPNTRGKAIWDDLIVTENNP